MAVYLTALALSATLSPGRQAGALAEVGLLVGAAQMTLHLTAVKTGTASCNSANPYSAVTSYGQVRNYACQGSITGQGGSLGGGGDRIADAYTFAGVGTVGVVTENMTYETGCTAAGYTVGNAHGTITFYLSANGVTTIGGEITTITQARVTSELWFSWSGNLGLGLARGLLIKFNDSSNRVFNDPDAVVSFVAVINNGVPVPCFTGAKDLQVNAQVTAAHNPA